MVEIVDQATGLLSKMSSDSNGLFQETTKEEREEAERKLNGIKANPYIVPATEQQNSLTEYHTENQNALLQFQPALVPQNTTIPAISSHGEQKEKHHHRYCPMIFDDITGCVTYVAKFHVNADDRISMNKYNTLSRVLRSERRADTIDIANIYIRSVKNYTTKFLLDIDFINANNIRQNKKVYIDAEDCVNNRLVDVLVENSICCFNSDISKKKISEYLYKLVLSKSGSEVYDLPKGSGFHILNGKYCFVTKEYCEENNYPEVTDKSFDMELSNEFNSETAEQEFLMLTKNHNSAEQFLMLNMIRITGLLSSPLYYCGYKFSRIVFVNGNSENLSRYLQIYERDFEILRPYSVNVKKEKLEEYFEDEQDNVIMLEDRVADSVYLKRNGTYAIEFLSNMIFEHKNSDYADYNFLTVVFSERLGQLMDSEKSLVLKFCDFKLCGETDRKDFFAPLYYLDKLVSDRVCSNFDDYESCIIQNYNKYSNIAKELSADENTFACLMLAYHEIIRQFKSVGELVSEEQMCGYLSRVLKESDNTYNGGSVSEEFKSKLNMMILNGEIELVENSSLNNCYGSTGTVPVVFSDDNWLYFPSDTFEYITSKITLANNINAVRKALFEKGLLKTFDNMTYKATLYDSRYSGKINVTAVNISVLSDEASVMQRGGMFNFTPCSDNGEIDRIFIGTDEKGRSVYWSIGHDELANKHMIVNGNPGMGKSTAVNLVIKESFSKKQNIVYVDFSCSASPNRLEENGIDKVFQEKNITRIDIDSVLENSKELETALDIMTEENQILLFEKSKYDSSIEEFLTLLYDTVTSKPELNIHLVIDEIHELEYKKESALYNIMEKGRGNGISLIGIFQGPHETKPKQYSMMNQADVKLIFKLGDRADAKNAAESNGLKPPGKFVDKIGSLKKRHCLVIGNLEDDMGELMNNRFIEITFPDIRK